MAWVSILVLIIFFFSFIRGLKDGAVKSFFSLISLIIAIPFAGIFYHLPGNILSFLPGEDWGNFIGFFITLAVINIILHFIFLLPRKLIQKVWKKGVLSRLIGGIINILNSATGLVVFSLSIQAFPLWGWLEQVVVNSSVLAWLVSHLSFVQTLLPEIFQQSANTVVAISALSSVLTI